MTRCIILFFAAATAALASCKTPPASGYGGDQSAAVRRISYATGPCFGTCPVYTVTVDSDGSGVFVGQSHTTVTGSRNFTVTPAQFDSFARHLAPLRPASGTVRYDSGSQCTSMATDLPSADVKWRGADGQEQELYVYFGCFFTGSEAMVQRLQQAPGLLPIGAFIH